MPKLIIFIAFREDWVLVTHAVTQGEMVWQGRADLVIGKCCVELKATSKPPSAAGSQLEDYIRLVFVYLISAVGTNTEIPDTLPLCLNL